MSKKSGRRAMPMRAKIGIGGAPSKAQQLERLQVDFGKMQDELKEQTVSVTAGGGVITVVAAGDQSIKSVHLEPEIVNPEDIEMLQDLIVAAVNEALDKSRSLMSQRLSGITGGLGLDGIL